jgi:tripartite-type tricarboxylate transporter receptor subunit TctC
LIAGNIATMFTTFATTRQHIASGRVRALAIAAKSRAKDFPQVPTMAEAGYAGFEASTWHSIVARAGTPSPILARLNSEIARILNGDEVRSTLVKAGFDIGAGSVEDFERFVRSEIDKWKKVATVAHIHLD